MKTRIPKYCIILLLLLCVAGDSFCQWKKIFDFDSPVISVYFLPGQLSPQIGFVGLFQQGGMKTTDAGKSWHPVYFVPDEYVGTNMGISNYSFKDSLTGWAASSVAKYCYKTTDGGENWSYFIYSNPFDIFYKNDIGVVFVASSEFSTNGILGYDEQGLPAIIISKQSNSRVNIGIAFSDSQCGIYSCAPGNSNLYTKDGGRTCTQSNDILPQFWCPTGIPGTQMFYALPYLGEDLYKSINGGKDWTATNKFPIYKSNIAATTGCIRSKSDSTLLLQTDSTILQGILTSNDLGNTWNSICGPTNEQNTRFFLYQNIIYAGDKYGGLWINTTGRGTGPRLQIDKDNNTRYITGAMHPFPVSIYYPHEPLTESTDSLSFIIKFTDAVGYVSDSIAAGWQVIRKEINANSMRFVLKPNAGLIPSPDSYLLKLYFQGIITKDTSATISLDEIDFNNYVTFRDCMIASLTKTDSISVDLQYQCADSILRKFMLSGYVPMKIISIRPNPAQDDIDIEINSQVKQDAKIELRNALGANVYSDSRSLLSGKNTIRLSTKALSSGMYLVRVISDGGEVEQSLVISR